MPRWETGLQIFGVLLAVVIGNLLFGPGDSILVSAFEGAIYGLSGIAVMRVLIWLVRKLVENRPGPGNDHAQ